MEQTREKLTRVAGGLLVLDGLLTILFGRRFVRLFQLGKRSNPYRRLIETLLRIPPWLLRAGGLAETILGLRVMGREPIQAQTLYRYVAGAYMMIDPGWRRYLYPQAHRAFDQQLLAYVTPGTRVLDLGCGIGGNLARLLFMDLPFGSYAGVDLTEAMLAQARSRFRQLPNVEFHQLDVVSDPLPEGPFDLVVSTWTLEHLAEPRAVLAKAWECSTPKAHMVLLFEIEGNTGKSRLVDRFYEFFDARLVPPEEIRQFPGLLSIDRFDGPLGELALVILEKPAGQG